MEAFSGVASRSVAAGNEFPAALELVVPQGYELVLLNGEDDWRSVTVLAGSTELATLRPGSIGLRSPFRSATCEAGGVFVDSDGTSRTEQEPAIFTAGRPGGRVSLYLCVPCLAADTAIIPQGRSAVLSLRCKSVQDFSWPVPPGQQVSIEIRTDSRDGWKQALETQGFTVTINGDTVRGSIGGIDDVRLAMAELQVDILR